MNWTTDNPETPAKIEALLQKLEEEGNNSGCMHRHLHLFTYTRASQFAPYVFLTTTILTHALTTPLYRGKRG